MTPANRGSGRFATRDDNASREPRARIWMPSSSSGDCVPTVRKCANGRQGAPHIEWLEIDYPELVRNPVPVIEKLVEFLGTDRLPRANAMVSVVDPALHRRKVT